MVSTTAPVGAHNNLVSHPTLHLWRGRIEFCKTCVIILCRQRACFGPPEYLTLPAKVEDRFQGGFCIQAPSHGSPHPDVLRTRPIHSSFYPPARPHHERRMDAVTHRLSAASGRYYPPGLSVCVKSQNHEFSAIFMHEYRTEQEHTFSFPNFPGGETRDLQESMSILATHTGRYPAAWWEENSISTGENRRVYGVYSTDC